MALGKTADKVRVKGGGNLEVKLSTSATWEDVGYLAESELIHEIETIKVNDETGTQVGEFDGNETVTFETQLLQPGVDEIDLIKDSSGKNYNARYKVQESGGDWQAWTLGASCTIRRTLRVPFRAGQANTIPLVLILNKGATTDLYYDVSSTPSEPTADGHWPTVN